MAPEVGKAQEIGEFRLYLNIRIWREQKMEMLAERRQERDWGRFRDSGQIWDSGQILCWKGPEQGWSWGESQQVPKVQNSEPDPVLLLKF